MYTFLELGGSPTSWLHTQNRPLLKLNWHWDCIGYMFHASCICTWAELDFYSFQYARIDRVNKGRINARRWPRTVAGMSINYSAAPAFRQRWTAVPCFIKSYNTSSATCTCTCIITSRSCLHFLRHELAPPPIFAFGKIIPSGLKMGAEHYNI